MPISDQPTSAINPPSAVPRSQPVVDESALLQAGLEATGGIPGFKAPTPEELAAAFPQLEITAVIGQGGMGAVYRAKQTHLDREVALKVLAPELSRDPAFVERFTREARLLARLNHPHLVTIHDFGTTNGYCWLIMELVEGANLRQVMRTGTLSAREALALVPQLCDALQYAHDEGIIHRDIKPENILLDRKGRVKIADFGLAKLREGKPDGHQLTASGVTLGTYHYMAPEQVENAKSVDHRADIYALGVVFYEMLTGGLPLGRFDPPSQRVQIDVRLDEVVLKALARNPDQRWQQASEVQQRVSDIAATQGSAVNSSAPEIASEHNKKRGLWARFIDYSERTQRQVHAAQAAKPPETRQKVFWDGLQNTLLVVGGFAAIFILLWPTLKSATHSAVPPASAVLVSTDDLTKILDFKPLAPIVDGPTARAVVDDLNEVVGMLEACPESVQAPAAENAELMSTRDLIINLNYVASTLKSQGVSHGGMYDAGELRKVIDMGASGVKRLRIQIAAGSLKASPAFLSILARVDQDVSMLGPEFLRYVNTPSRDELRHMLEHVPRIANLEDDDDADRMQEWLLQQGREVRYYTMDQAGQVISALPKPFRLPVARFLSLIVTGSSTAWVAELNKLGVGLHEWQIRSFRQSYANEGRSLLGLGSSLGNPFKWSEEAAPGVDK